MFKSIIYTDETTLTSVLGMFKGDVHKSRSEYI